MHNRTPKWVCSAIMQACYYHKCKHGQFTRSNIQPQPLENWFFLFKMNTKISMMTWWNAFLDHILQSCQDNTALLTPKIWAPPLQACVGCMDLLWPCLLTFGKQQRFFNFVTYKNLQKLNFDLSELHMNILQFCFVSLIFLIVICYYLFHRKLFFCLVKDQKSEMCMSKASV